MNKDDVAGLVEKLTPALKLLEELEVGQDCPEYAYAKGKGFQSMTYIPEAFEALRELPVMLDALTTLSARVETLEEGLNAIIDRGPERDIKWAGMSAKDIALHTLQQILEGTGND